MSKGTVKWYNATKGFGFIKPDNSNADVFVHVTALEKSNISTIAEGQRVTFEVLPGRKGDQAVNLSFEQ